MRIETFRHMANERGLTVGINEYDDPDLLDDVTVFSSHVSGYFTITKFDVNRWDESAAKQFIDTFANAATYLPGVGS